MWSAEQLAADLRAPLRPIPGGRHFTLEDHPDVIAAAVRAVLADATGSADRSAGSGTRT